MGRDSRRPKLTDTQRRNLKAAAARDETTATTLAEWRNRTADVYYERFPEAFTTLLSRMNDRGEPRRDRVPISTEAMESLDELVETAPTLSERELRDLMRRLMNASYNAEAAFEEAFPDEHDRWSKSRIQDMEATRTYKAMMRYSNKEDMSEDDWDALSELTLIDRRGDFGPTNVRCAKTAAEREANKLFYRQGWLRPQ